MKLKLNIKKIKKERERLGLSQNELAVKMGWSRQRLSYVLQQKLIAQAHVFGKVFDLNGKDLIK